MYICAYIYIYRYIHRRTLQLQEKEIKQKERGICQAMRIKEEDREEAVEGRLGAVKNHPKEKVPSSSRGISARRASPRKRVSG